MDALTAFFQHNIVLVYFFYGLAFFCMGLIVLIESRRTSAFHLAEALGFLAAFGILHGLHEWFEMFQRLGATGATAIPEWLLLDQLRIAHLVVSFIMLVLFGMWLIFSSRMEKRKGRILAYAGAGALVAVWLLTVLSTWWIYQPSQDEFITAVDVLSRYILGIPGAILAAWAIILEQRSFRAHDLPETSLDLQRAALALILYGFVGQMFTEPTFFFPATVINANLFVQWFGIPVQVFRAVMAVLVAVFMVLALRAFETERQRNLARANEERLAAQRKALTVQESARAEMETLNKELQTAVQDLTLLFDLSRTLAATLDRQTLLNTAINQIAQRLPRVERGIIVLRQKPGKPLDCAACTGHPDCQTQSPCQQAQALTHYIQETATPVCSMGDQIIPLSLDSPESFVDDDPILAITDEAAIGIPLQVQDYTVGSLVLHLDPTVNNLRMRDLSLLSIIAGLLSIAIENATRYEEAQAREALRGELLHQVVSAQERERQRIARELHDSTGQTLTALGLGFAAVAETVQSDPDLAVKQVKELKQMSMEALAELRDMIRDLRPSLLDDLGLVPALQNQIQMFQTHTGVQADLQITSRIQRLSPDVETILFRIAQEALTNVAKHAHAQHVNLQLQFDPDAVHLQVRDDGHGFQPEAVFETGDQPRHAWGLLGMQERVSLVGGECQIVSTVGEGTAVNVTIPFNEHDKLGDMVALENMYVK